MATTTVGKSPTGIQSPADTQCKFCGALLLIDELEKHMATEVCNNSPQCRAAGLTAFTPCKHN
jgi:hypothetical protein